MERREGKKRKEESSISHVRGKGSINIENHLCGDTHLKIESLIFSILLLC